MKSKLPKISIEIRTEQETTIMNYDDFNKAIMGLIEELVWEKIDLKEKVKKEVEKK